MPATIPLDADKGSQYYALDRCDVVAQLRRPLGRVLDVGCGAGGAADPLRGSGATWISGIELMPEPAARARQRYDEVRVGDALEQVSHVTAPFDTILCYDVLEHLYDPLALLSALLGVAAARGRIHVSVPNARHVSLLRDLIVRGTFGYTASGHRDATHLRWFTRTDIAQLVSEAGWLVEGTRASVLQWRSRALHRVTGGRSTEYLSAQWYVLARKH